MADDNREKKKRANYGFLCIAKEVNFPMCCKSQNIQEQHYVSIILIDIWVKIMQI